MWFVNVILIVGLLAFLSWFFVTYGGELNKASSVLFSGSQSILFVMLLLVWQALQAALLGVIIGGICGVIFTIAGAPNKIITSTTVTVAVLAFTLLMLKALIEDWQNLRYSFRNKIRNTYSSSRKKRY